MANSAATQEPTEQWAASRIDKVLTWLAATACLVVAIGLGGLIAIGAGETAPGMPIAPRPIALAGAAAAGLLIMVSRRQTRAGLLIGAAIAMVIMVSGSAAAIPHTALILIILTVSQFTQVGGPFTLDPPVLTMITHLVTAGATFLGGWWLLTRWRELRGLCSACGRTDANPTPITRPAVVPLLAAIAIIGALPYGAIKLAWAVGLKIGLPGSSFDAVTFGSPGFGDTAALTGLSIIASVLMGLRLRQRLVRIGLITIGTIGSFMLVPVGTFGAIIGLIPAALGLRPIGDSEIAGWAYATIYSSFLVWGLGLCLLTVTYVRATRPLCRRHVVPA